MNFIELAELKTKGKKKKGCDIVQSQNQIRGSADMKMVNAIKKGKTSEEVRTQTFYFKGTR